MSAEGEGPIPHRRRSSIVEMFSGRGSANTSAFSTSPPAGVPANPNVSHRKSMSMALGLAGSVDNQNSPYNAFARQRRASISTSNGSPEFRNSFDDNAAIVEEEDRVGSMNTPPSPSFARRLSFGAQAMKDVRGGISPSNAVGRRPSSALYALSEDGNSTQAHAKSRSSRTAKTGGEGFNWSDSMLDSTRKPSTTSSNPFATTHSRTRSVNMNSPVEPPKEMPKTPTVTSPTPRLKKPDHLGERMLRGDFMMD